MRPSGLRATACAAIVLGAWAAAAPIASAHRRHCTEVSQVVGFEQCRQYGDGWAVGDAPRFFWGADFVVDRLGGGSSTLSASATHLGVSYPLELHRTAENLYGVRARIGIFATPWLYFAASVEGALGSQSPGVVTSRGALYNANVTSVFAFHGEVAPGVLLPLGPLSLRAEVGLGLGTIQTRAEAFGADWSSSTGVFEISVVVEPRVEVDYWLTPWITIGVSAGENFVGPSSETELSIGFSSHVRAYDGRG